MIETRINKNFLFYLLIAAVASLSLSLFLLQLFAGLLSVCWLMESVNNKRKALDIFAGLILIFGLIRIISIIFSQYPSVSVQSLYKDALFYFSFFAFSYYLKAFGKDRVKTAAYSFIISAAAIALIGLVLFNLKIVDRAQSFSSGYATFSSYLLAALGVFIALPFSFNKKFMLEAWSLAIALVLSGIITSMGRTNIAIAGLLFIAGISLRKINIKSALIIIILTAVITLISFNNNKAEVTQRVEHPAALSDRNILLRGAEVLAFSHPAIGFGPRTFHNIFPYKDELSDKGIGSWHNDFIQVYFESGIFGLLAFLALIFAVCYYSASLLKKKLIDKDYKQIALGILLGSAGLVLSAVTAGFIDSPVLSIEFSFLISLLAAVMYNVKNSAEQSA